ncbi:MAG: lipase [Proteobacteria bacterium]|nr:MAG: lipase [Pseudomonadota bacterium]
MKYLWIASCITALFMVTGCSDDSDYDFEASQQAAEASYAENVALAPIFDPQNAKIPSTNDLLLAGSNDGTLNIPTENADAGKKTLLNALNTLDGFALTAPITADFNNTIKADTVVIGSTVHMFEVTKDPATGAVTGVVSELGASDILATVDSAADTLVLLPLKPLKESTSYMVVITNSVTNPNNTPARTPSAYLLAKSSSSLTGSYAALEPLRQLIATQEAAAVTQGITKNRIILSWTFTTQSVSPVLQAAKSKASASLIQAATTTLNTQDANASLRGSASIYVGVLGVPYYLDKNNPLTSYWKGANDSFLTRYNPTPVATNSALNIPLLMTVPNTGTMPTAGWPVVIFQHGITRNRTDLLAIADTLAEAGYAAVAIDLPLHGITDNSNPFYTAFERTFDLDLQNNDTSASGKDGKIDNSGSYFINLTNLPTGRDNIRQSISDLLVLRNSLPNLNVSGVKLDTSKVGFVGISLGGIIGTGYLSQESTRTPASLIVTGGGIARLLDGSETYGSHIQASLAANGVVKGTANYDAFMSVAQTVLDAADPVVLGAQAANTHPIHMIEVVGVNGVGADTVVPNRVAGAPLSGTEALAKVMALPSITQTTTGTGIVRFSQGVHSSLLDPTASLAVTTEMQRQMVAFQASNGQRITLTDLSVISTETP